ncbi:flagellar hook-basal body protein [bacterium]|nr:flagellar hook-basal body protein [bacterium]
MLEGMRMAAQGMMTQAARQDVITNNLANVGTAGFRKESTQISSFNQILNREVGDMDGIHQTSADFSGASGVEISGGLSTSSVTHSAQGSLKETGNPFDMALDDNGRGFFTIQTKDGLRFTRAGNFHLATNGELVTADGSQVMGHRGPIKLQGSNFTVSNDGIISSDGKPIDKILVTVFENDGQLKRTGDNQFAATSKVSATNNFQLKQGYIEMANVNAINEMVDLMMVTRNYEANQKVLQANDRMLERTNSVGQVR